MTRDGIAAHQSFYMYEIQELQNQYEILKAAGQWRTKAAIQLRNEIKEYQRLDAIIYEAEQQQIQRVIEESAEYKQRRIEQQARFLQEQMMKQTEFTNVGFFQQNMQKIIELNNKKFMVLTYKLKEDDRNAEKRGIKPDYKTVIYFINNYITDLVNSGKFSLDGSVSSDEELIGSDSASFDADYELVKVSFVDADYMNSQQQKGYQQYIEKHQAMTDKQIEKEREADDGMNDQFEEQYKKDYAKELAEQKRKKANKLKQGAYMNKLNKTMIDLGRYQIGRTVEEHSELNYEHCFINVLIQSQLYTDSEIENIQLQIVNLKTLFSLSKIKNLTGYGRIECTYFQNGRKETRQYFEKGSERQILQMGFFNEHYFIDDQENGYSEKIIRQLKAMYPSNKSINMKWSILNVFNFMQNNGLFQEIEGNIGINALIDKRKNIGELYNIDGQYKCDIPDIDEIEGNQKDLQDLREPKMYDDYICADFEAFTKNSKGNNIEHDDFILCYRTKYGKYAVSNFQKMINKISGNVVVYFHNLCYDAQFILRTNFTIGNEIVINGKLSQFKIFTKDAQITFRDSILLFQCPLSSLPKMFGITQQKEIFPYDYYTRDRYDQKFGLIDQAYKYVKNATIEEFRTALLKSNAMTKSNEFDMVRYASYYCMIDVDILYDSITTFRQWINAAFKLDILNFVSISSLSLKYQMNEGCFDDVYKLSGNLRKFIQQSVVGGRCMVRDNKKMNVHEKICDLDGNSLYPSAQKRSYYPSGVPYLMKNECVDGVNAIDYYNDVDNLMDIHESDESQETLYVQVKLSKPSKELHFPLISEKKEGIRNFTNEPKEIHTMSHVQLQDAVKFQGYKYEILSGVMFKKRNYKIAETIQYMYDKRVEYRNAKNPIQIVFKMLLNVSYGKTIEKLHDTQTKIINKDKWVNYVIQHQNHVLKIQDMGNKFLITSLREVAQQWTYPHVGSLILGYSKRIMNEVMCLAEELDIKIYYQDTDSMIMQMDKVDQLVKQYKIMYERDLIGDNELGKFGDDFESEQGEVLFSNHLIALGKKCYVHNLVVMPGGKHVIVNNKALNLEQLKALHMDDIQKLIDCGQLICEQHIRMKGIPANSIYDTANKEKKTIMQLYEDMYRNIPKTFDMVKGRAVVMKKVNWSSYINLQSGDAGTTRCVSFLDPEFIYEADDM